MALQRHVHRCSIGSLGIALAALLIAGIAGVSEAKVHRNPGVPASAASIELQAATDPNWVKAQQEVYRSVLDITSQHQSELQSGVCYRKFMHGDEGKKRIAITFDDGPHPRYTPQLLAILKQYKAKATFFVVGEMAQKYPDLVRAELAAGNAIGNHTYHHVNLTKIPDLDIPTEIQACSDVLKSITGKRPRLFRPPGGDYDRQVANYSAMLGYTMVLWTDDPGDYASPGAAIIKTRLLDRVGNGGIILIHDGVQQTVDVLPQILTYLRSKGYEFVTIDQMIKHYGQNSTAMRSLTGK